MDFRSVQILLSVMGKPKEVISLLLSHLCTYPSVRCQSIDTTREELRIVIREAVRGKFERRTVSRFVLA